MQIDIKEVLFLERNKFIKDKLMILSVYKEFQNLFIDLPKDLSDRYKEETNIEFTSLVDKIRQEEREVNAEEFLREYFKSIKSNPSFSLTPVSLMTKLFASCINQLDEEYKDVRLIDDFDYISLPDKLDLLETYRATTNSSAERVMELYGSNKTSGLLNRYNDTALEYLDDYLSYNMYDHDEMNISPSALRNYITEGSKKFFMSELNNNRFEFEDIEEPESRRAFDELSEPTKKYWLVDMVYYVSDYQIDHPKKITERINDQLNYMEVSPEVRNMIEYKMKIMTYKYKADEDNSKGLR